MSTIRVIAALAFALGTGAVQAQVDFNCVAPSTPTLVNPVVLGNGTAGSVGTAALQTALNTGGPVRLNIGTSTLA